MSTVVQLSTSSAAPKAAASAVPPKDLYEIGEIPPLGHIPSRMYAWAIRKDRHGPPETSFQVEVLPTWEIADDEVAPGAAGEQVAAGGVHRQSANDHPLPRPGQADLPGVQGFVEILQHVRGGGIYVGHRLRRDAEILH